MYVVWRVRPSVAQQERLDIEEKYTSLQDAATGKTHKLNRVWTLLMQSKSEASLTAQHTHTLANRATTPQNTLVQNSATPEITTPQIAYKIYDGPS